jgi:hypothetical protein
VNAFDPRSDRPDGRALSDGSTSLLRQAVTSRLNDPAAPETELREALHVVAAEARARGLRPEELVITLKALFDATTVDVAPHGAEEGRKLREWIVATCIRAYYTPRAAPQ